MLLELILFTPETVISLFSSGFAINLDDGDPVNFGNSNGLHIQHNGVNGVIENRQGDLIINTNVGERAIDAEVGAGVLLHFAGTKKAETVTGGFTIQGVCTATSFTGALNNGVTATTQSASDNSTKVATTAYVDNQVTAGATNEFADNVFRVKDNSDASKKLAFECSGISGSTTRTMTVPNTDGTISTESFATAIAVALG